MTLPGNDDRLTLGRIAATVGAVLKLVILVLAPAEERAVYLDFARALQMKA